MSGPERASSTVRPSVCIIRVCDIHIQTPPAGAAPDTLFLFQELKQQSEALEFDIALKCLSVLRYITDHTDR